MYRRYCFMAIETITLIEKIKETTMKQSRNNVISPYEYRVANIKDDTKEFLLHFLVHFIAYFM